MTTGPRNLITDVAGLRVGQAVDQAARTGVTLLLPDAPVKAAADVRGGGPGTRETDALRLDTLVDRVDAIVLSGGSVYGLGAADAVCRLLGARRRGFSLVENEGVPVSPIVPAAILYDLANGGEKAWGETPPYARLGEAAFAAAGEELTLGRAGAGFGAEAGAYPGGVGSASFVTSGGYTVGALAAVNSFGSPYVPGSDSFWAAPFEMASEFGGRGMPAGSHASGIPDDTKLGASVRTNTTIAIVATDADLCSADLQRVAIMAQDGLARALRPAHGPTDGDVVFAVSTCAKPVGARPLLAVTEIASAAADTLARAIARGVYEAEPSGG